MTIIAVDDNAADLQLISQIIETNYPEAYYMGCSSSFTALAAAREHVVDVAFLDITMPEVNGLTLGQYLKDLNPFINLIFLTEHKEYAFDAMKLHPSGYLAKPASFEAVKAELEMLRYPEEHKQGKRVFCQTFGNFEIFVDGKPVAFKYTKTKEIVAILVNNRGAQTTSGEIIACLWEDDGDPEKKRSYLSNLRQDLQNTFSRLNLTGLLIKQRGSLAIAVDRVECDLFDWLEKREASKYHYLGDYMNQYSWAEFRHAELDEISYAMEDAK